MSLDRSWWMGTLAATGMVGMLVLASCVGEDAPRPGGASSGATSGGASSGTSGGASDGGTSSGGETDAGADPKKRFLGTWSTTTAVQTVYDCNNGAAAVNSQPQAITLSVTEGAESDLVVTNSIAANCVLRFDVVGGVAKMVEGVTCTAQFQNGVTDTYRYATTSAFSLTSDTQGTMVLEATVTSSTGLECQFRETSPHTKQ